MPENPAKYRIGLRWTILMVLLVSFGGCRWLSFFMPQEEVCEETEVIDEDLERYLDSVQWVENQRWDDSCELVLQSEWDSLMQALADSMAMVNYVNNLADSIILYASEFMHVPYRLGGNGPKAFDCSGFTRYVFGHFGYALKRTVPGQLDDGWRRIDDTAELRRGDLAFFGGRKNPAIMGHVAIVVDNDPETHVFTFIHATLRKGVIISASNEKYYKIRYMTACRILP